MRQADTDSARTRGLTRRQYVQILAGASAASIAGCTGDGDGGGSGDGSGEDPQSNTIRTHVDNIPSQANMNIWAPNDRTQGELVMTELTAPRDFLTNEKYLNGHTWDSPWIDDHDEISIPTVFDDYRVEPPYDTYEMLRGHEDGQEPLYFWDNEQPIDAETFLQSWRVDWHNGDNHLDETATFNYEAQSDYVFHSWENRGEVEGQPDNARNEAVLDSNAVPTHELTNVMHPGFTQSFAEDYQDATTQEATDGIHEDLEGTRISFEQFREEGWGSGLYRTNPDTITANELTLELWDEHPNEHATVEEVQIQFASAGRRQALASFGELDLDERHVQEEASNINRQILPDHMQELSRYPTNNGDQWAMNWNNPHLQRLWVRRAIIAAIDWFDFTGNGWGPGGSTPQEYAACAPDGSVESQASQEFLDNLHSYPLEQDLDLASDYLERAGYTGSQGGGWTGPGGRDFTLTLELNSGIAEWIPATDTAQSHLSEAGIEASVEPLDQPSFLTRQGQGNANEITYGACIMWSPSGPIWNWYNANGANYTFPIVGGDPESEGGAGGQPDYENLQSDVDNHGRPFVQQVPTESGAFEAPDEAGRAPELPMESEEVNLAQECLQLREPGFSQDEIQQKVQTLARYANYYVPFFTFHSLLFGVWGNVRDFSWPNSDHLSLRAEKEYDNVHYNYHAGLAQEKFDSDYPAPGSD